jgi:hypothetical protein
MLNMAKDRGADNNIAMIDHIGVVLDNIKILIHIKSADVHNLTDHIGRPLLARKDLTIDTGAVTLKIDMKIIIGGVIIIENREVIIGAIQDQNH